MARVWGIVLAGGVGSRLGAEAERRYGYPRPKQFCDFDGRGTLLERTLGRARALAPDDRLVVVTTRPWSEREAAECLADSPRIHHVAQPLGKETGPGILLPLLHVAALDPNAIVAILPSDHHIERDDAFVDGVKEAVAAVSGRFANVVLLGAPADEIEDGLGWIVPEGDAWCARVRAFREKPPAAEAARLSAAGALVNTFVMVARVSSMVDLCKRWMPAWSAALRTGAVDAVDRAYRELPAENFSRAVLERGISALHVMSLGDVGWSDVGTPERLRRSIEAAPEGRVARVAREVVAAK